tara:strand:- start:19 stop:309 length:291 start_codon:yes stop_codon:yes gene_type:complete
MKTRIENFDSKEEGRITYKIDWREAGHLSYSTHHMTNGCVEAANFEINLYAEGGSRTLDVYIPVKELPKLIEKLTNLCSTIDELEAEYNELLAVSG